MMPFSLLESYKITRFINAKHNCKVNEKKSATVVIMSDLKKWLHTNLGTLFSLCLHAIVKGLPSIYMPLFEFIQIIHNF